MWGLGFALSSFPPMSCKCHVDSTGSASARLLAISLLCGELCRRVGSKQSVRLSDWSHHSQSLTFVTRKPFRWMLLAGILSGIQSAGPDAVGLGCGPGIYSFNTCRGWLLWGGKSRKHCFIVYFLSQLPFLAEYSYSMNTTFVMTSVWQRRALVIFLRGVLSYQPSYIPFHSYSFANFYLWNNHVCSLEESRI